MIKLLLVYIPHGCRCCYQRPYTPVSNTAGFIGYAIVIVFALVALYSMYYYLVKK